LSRRRSLARRAGYHRAAVNTEARLHPRFAIDAHADVIGEEVVLCRPLGDISLGGCRFWGAGWEAAGTEVQLVLTFPSLRANLPITGVVVRSSSSDMGVRFHNMTDEQKWALRKHLRDLQTASPPQ
jgi:hypothetical protein